MSNQIRSIHDSDFNIDDYPWKYAGTVRIKHGHGPMEHYFDDDDREIGYLFSSAGLWVLFDSPRIWDPLHLVNLIITRRRSWRKNETVRHSAH